MKKMTGLLAPVKGIHLSLYLIKHCDNEVVRRAPGIRWIGSWMDYRTSLDPMEKRKFFPLSGIEPMFLSHQSIAQLSYH
jgi:hypothetical protein